MIFTQNVLLNHCLGPPNKSSRRTVIVSIYRKCSLAHRIFALPFQRSGWQIVVLHGCILQQPCHHDSGLDIHRPRKWPCIVISRTPLRIVRATSGSNMRSDVATLSLFDAVHLYDTTRELQLAIICCQDTIHIRVSLTPQS